MQHHKSCNKTKEKAIKEKEEHRSFLNFYQKENKKPDQSKDNDKVNDKNVDISEREPEFKTIIVVHYHLLARAGLM